MSPPTRPPPRTSQRKPGHPEQKDEHPDIPRRPSRAAAVNCKEPPVIILGILLLIIGFVTGIAILWTIGIVVVIIGAILWILGMAGHAVGGRKHYF